MTNKTLNIEENLGKVSKVSPPPFLFTRIEARIDADFAPSTLTFAGLSLALSCVIILLNVWLVFGTESNDFKAENNELISTYVNSIGLNESNHIYHD